MKENYEWDWTGVERLCKQAIALSPNYGEAHHMCAAYLAEVGRMPNERSEQDQLR